MGWARVQSAPHTAVEGSQKQVTRCPRELEELQASSSSTKKLAKSRQFEITSRRARAY